MHNRGGRSSIKSLTNFLFSLGFGNTTVTKVNGSIFNLAAIRRGNIIFLLFVLQRWKNCDKNNRPRLNNQINQRETRRIYRYEYQVITNRYDFMSRLVY